MLFLTRVDSIFFLITRGEEDDGAGTIFFLRWFSCWAMCRSRVVVLPCLWAFRFLNNVLGCCNFFGVIIKYQTEKKKMD